MPIQSTRPVGLVAEQATPSIADQRARRDERLSSARTASARTREKLLLERTLIALLVSARGWRDHATAQNELEDRKAQLELANLGADEGDSRRTVAAVITGPVKWIAVLIIDLCLLASTAHLLISMVYVTPGGPPWAAVVAVPLALFAFELSVSTHIAEERRSRRVGERVGDFRWLLVGSLLSVVVPMLGAAALLEALSEGGIVMDLSGKLLLVGVVLLGAAAHGAVIMGGASAVEALRVLTYLPRLASLTRQISIKERGAVRSRDRARDALVAYEGSLETYRTSFGEPPRRLLIQRRDASLINDAIGEVVVTIPDVDERRAAPDGAPAHEAAAGAPPPPRPPEAPYDEPRRDEEEYLREILRGRLADTDGEIRP